MLTASGVPTIENIVLPFKNTEYVISIQKHVKKIMIQVREFKELYISFTEGMSGSNYFTLKSGCTYYEDNVQGPFTVVMQGTEDNTTIEFVTWSHWD